MLTKGIMGQYTEKVRLHMKQKKQDRHFEMNQYYKPSTEYVCSVVKGCIFCDIIYNKPELVLYKDDHCAIFKDKVQRGKLYFQCVPLRHIRDIHHLRPNIIGDPGGVLTKRYKRNLKSEQILNNAGDEEADINLLKHMVKVG